MSIANTKVTLDVNAETIKKLEPLCELTGLTLPEFFKASLDLFSTAVHETTNGRRLGVVDEPRKGDRILYSSLEDLARPGRTPKVDDDADFSLAFTPEQIQKLRLIRDDRGLTTHQLMKAIADTLFLFTEEMAKGRTIVVMSEEESDAHIENLKVRF